MRPHAPSESSCHNSENLTTFLKNEHRGYVANKHLSKATGAHFNLPGHSTNDMRVTILEKVHSMDPLVRKEREELFIRKFNTKYKGMNKK